MNEVTLQNIGIANLSLRLGKQKHSTNMANKEQKLTKKASALRDQLANLVKLRRTKQIEELTKEVENLEMKREKLNDLLHRDMELGDLALRLKHM